MEFASLFQWVLGKGVLIFGLATVFVRFFQIPLLQI